MKKITVIIVALVVIAVAILVAVAIDGNQASAFPTGWAGGCGNVPQRCHGPCGHGSRGYLRHCANCHAATPGAKANVDAGSARYATVTECHALGQNASTLTPVVRPSPPLVIPLPPPQQRSPRQRRPRRLRPRHSGAYDNDYGAPRPRRPGPPPPRPAPQRPRPVPRPPRPAHDHHGPSTTTTVTSAPPDYTG